MPKTVPIKCTFFIHESDGKWYHAMVFTGGEVHHGYATRNSVTRAIERIKQAVDAAKVVVKP